MASFSRGRCLLKPILKRIGLTQAELARRTGYEPRMISFFATGGKMMSAEAMYSITQVIRQYIPEFRMEELYEWMVDNR